MCEWEFKNLKGDLFIKLINATVCSFLFKRKTQALTR